jgi:hypothetical protein
LAAGPAAAAALQHRLTIALRSGRLVLRAHPFSVAPFGYRAAPNDLLADFASAKLTIMKGDLNYRRLVGDNHQEATVSFQDSVGYFPGAVVALRTLKSEVIVGLDPARLTALEGTGESWRTTGRYGLVQLAL